MWRNLIFVSGLLAGFGAAHGAGDRFLVGGIQVNESDHARWTAALAEGGLNTVAVTVYAHQGDWDGDNLWFAAAEPAVVDEIRSAKAAGLSVVLILRVAIDHAFPRNEFIWHGMIMPRDDRLLDSWFEKYRTFARKWAQVADAEGVDVLGIGSEMNAMDSTLPLGRLTNAKNFYVQYWYDRLYRRWLLRHGDIVERRHLNVPGAENVPSLRAFLDSRFTAHREWARQVGYRGGSHVLKRVNQRRARLEAHWRKLIAEIRALYPGRLTYAANFDSYMNVGFWDALDMLGINAYFSLRDLPEAPERFEPRWTAILDRIEDVQRRRDVSGMPVLFTELGYTARRHTTVQPWSYGDFSIVGWKKTKRLLVWDDQPIDRTERARAVGALAAVHASRPGSPLAGVLYWKLSTRPEHARIEPFVLVVGDASDDPLVEALASFSGGRRDFP